MALSVGDVIQLLDVQSYLGQTVLNVYFYEMVEVGADVTLEDVGNVFQTTVIQEIRDIQADELEHIRVILRNLTNGVDIFEEPISVIGAQNGGEPLASFYAASFRLVRSTATTRHGSKRIAGLTENLVLGNLPAASMLTLITPIEAAMGGVLEVDAGGAEDFIAKPVIVGRYPQGDPNEGELNLSVINDVASAQFIRLSTQTTRRAGRGV